MFNTPYTLGQIATLPLRERAMLYAALDKKLAGENKEYRRLETMKSKR